MDSPPPLSIKSRPNIYVPLLMFHVFPLHIYVSHIRWDGPTLTDAPTTS